MLSGWPSGMPAQRITIDPERQQKFVRFCFKLHRTFSIQAYIAVVCFVFVFPKMGFGKKTNKLVNIMSFFDHLQWILLSLKIMFHNVLSFEPCHKVSRGEKKQNSGGDASLSTTQDPIKLWRHRVCRAVDGGSLLGNMAAHRLSPSLNRLLFTLKVSRLLSAAPHRASS